MTRPRRPNLYLTGALRRKYGQLLGEARDLLADRPRIKADLEHVGAVLRMFDPDADLAAITPIRPYKARRGRWNRTALKILREANAPMRGRDLARRVMLAHGLEPDFRTMVSIECSLQAVLLRLHRMGLVTITGKPRRWSIGN